MKGLVLLSLLLAGLTAPAWAVNPDEMLKDPALETRARELGRELRCLVCQNESIDDSNADLARDLRVLVRERVAKGDSDEQVKQFVVDRYGDYVLLRPPFKASTYVLWFGPAIFMALAAFTGWRFYRRRAMPGEAAPSPAPLSAAEQRRLAALMRDEAQDDARQNNARQDNARQANARKDAP